MKMNRICSPAMTIGSTIVVILGLILRKFSMETQFPFSRLPLHVQSGVNGGWEPDSNPDEVELRRSDIDRIHFSKLSVGEFEMSYREKKPVIIEGLAAGTGWPSREEGRWSRASLIENYGSRLVNVASGAGIVYSGGGQTRSVSLAQFLNGLNTSQSELPSGKDFIFDVGFMTRNPELLKDFATPSHFMGFSGEKNVALGNSWYVASIGGSRSGLPFHTHGETWLGLVYGSKRWFLYPPGQSPSAEVVKDVNWHPLLGVYEWLSRVLPILPLKDRPLQFVQRAGDVVYLPSNWRHATLNIGESVGVGGQALYRTTQREKDCLKILEKFPNDVDAIRGVGLSLAHKGVNLPTDGPIGPDSLDDRTRLLRKSADHFYRAMELQPGDPEIALLLGEVLLYLGEKEAAGEVAVHAAKALLPSFLPVDVPLSTVVAARSNLARFMTSAGLHMDAEILLRNGVIDAVGRFPEVVITLSTSLAGQDKWEEAFHELEVAIEMYPNAYDEISKHVAWLKKQQH